MTHRIFSSSPSGHDFLNTIVPTSIPNVTATVKAYPLAKLFFSCPHAAQSLNEKRFIKPIFIDSQNILRAMTIRNLDKESNPIEAKIVIPEVHLQTSYALRDLSFEIFNAQRTSLGLYRQARLGNVGMDSFARQLEERERADTQEHFELIKQCGKYHWAMAPEELETYTLEENQPLEVDLFEQEVTCHTDNYRQRWIEQYQKIYCKKHPGDKRSCTAKKTDLCDPELVRRLSSSERIEFESERICERFPEAHVTVKNDPGIRAVIQAKCLKLLRNSSHQSIQEDL